MSIRTGTKCRMSTFTHTYFIIQEFIGIRSNPFVCPTERDNKKNSLSIENAIPLTPRKIRKTNFPFHSLFVSSPHYIASNGSSPPLNSSCQPPHISARLQQCLLGHSSLCSSEDEIMCAFLLPPLLLLLLFDERSSVYCMPCM